MARDWMIFVVGTTGKRRRDVRWKTEVTNIIQDWHRLAGGGVWEDAGAQQGCAASIWGEKLNVSKFLLNRCNHKRFCKPAHPAGGCPLLLLLVN